jgi:hypothetical protein
MIPDARDHLTGTSKIRRVRPILFHLDLCPNQATHHHCIPAISDVESMLPTTTCSINMSGASPRNPNPSPPVHFLSNPSNPSPFPTAHHRGRTRTRWYRPPQRPLGSRGEARELTDLLGGRNRGGEPSNLRIRSFPFTGDRRRSRRFAQLRPPLPPSTTSSPSG